ncbi:RUN and SH3 domain-containing protein 1, partial [Colius striatus]
GRGSRSLHSLCCHVAGLTPLSSTRQKFHAFILGLLNTKQLELWICHLQKSPGVVSLLYSPTAFFALSQGPLPQLADELLLLLQPLSVLTFHLDLLFEHHHLSVDVRPFPGPQVGAVLHETLQHVLRWGDQLSRALLRAESSQETCRSQADPQDTGLGLSAWWGQLSQASRIDGAPSKEKSPCVWWTKLGSGAAPPEAEAHGPAAPAKGSWLGGLFGATNPSASPATVSARSRRPSSWLSPSTRVLAMMVKGLVPEKTQVQGEAEKNPPEPPQTHRAVRALCDHTGTADGHLSFQKGDILQLLSTVDEDWICCCHGNSTGLVPVGYTSLIL